MEQEITRLFASEDEQTIISNVQSQTHTNLTSEVEIGTDPEAVKRKIEMKLLNPESNESFSETAENLVKAKINLTLNN